MNDITDFINWVGKGVKSWFGGGGGGTPVLAPVAASFSNQQQARNPSLMRSILSTQNISTGLGMIVESNPLGGIASSLYEIGTGQNYFTGVPVGMAMAMTGMIPSVRIVRNIDRVAQGSYGALKYTGKKDAHHIIQDAAVRNLPGYSKSRAPAIQLTGPSTRAGTAHQLATQIQRQAGGGTYASERRIGYKALRRAGLSVDQSREAIQLSDRYFNSIGVSLDTVTRIPGNRR